MIVCNRCGKENQDHYKFCLGCGAELVSGPGAGEGGNVGTMKTMMAEQGPRAAPTPPGGVPHGGNSRLPGVGAPPPGIGPMPGMGPGPGMGAQPGPGPQYGGPRAPAGPPPGVGAPGGYGGTGPGPAPAPGGYGGPRPNAGGWGAPAPAPGMGNHGSGPAPAPHMGPGAGPGPGAPQAGPRTCTQCGAEVPPNFKFCGVCGNPLGAAPASPSPFGRDDATGPVFGGAQPGSAPAPRADMPRALLTLIRPDGTEGGTFTLREGENRIGRDHGDIFENDGYLSPNHCDLTVQGQGAVVRDLDSLNGVFVRMSGEEEIQPGQVIRMGQELLRFDLIEPPAPLDDGTEVMGSPNPGYWGKITVMIGNGVDGSAYPLLGDSVTMGRERGDINFPDDGYVSGLHARMTTRGGKVYLADLGSSNGTFLRVQGERGLSNESFVLLGQQLFRLSLR